MSEASSPHRHSVRVYWEDTDAGGIVYHANYLKFAERARSEFVREAGISQSALADGGKGYAFAVRKAEMEFLRSARLDDLLQVESVVTEVGGASLAMSQVIRRSDDDVELVHVNVLLAFISLDGRAARMPAPIRDLLRALV